MKTFAFIVMLGAVVRLEAAAVFDFSADMRFNSIPQGIQTYLTRNPDTASFFLTNIVAKSLVAGDNAVFTVPAGCRGLALQCQLLTTNAVTFYTSLVNGGVHYRTTVGPLSTSAATPAANGLLDSIVREAGEGFGVHLGGDAPAAYYCIAVFTNTIPWKSPKLLSLAGGDNTVYTVPANTVAIGMSYPLVTPGPNLRYVNDSGLSRNIRWYFLPAGETTASFPVLNTNTVASASGASVGVLQGYVMKAGDSIVINTDAATATQSAWVGSLLEVTQ